MFPHLKHTKFKPLQNIEESGALLLGIYLLSGQTQSPSFTFSLEDMFLDASLLRIRTSKTGEELSQANQGPPVGPPRITKARGGILGGIFKIIFGNKISKKSLIAVG